MQQPPMYQVGLLVETPWVGDTHEGKLHHGFADSSLVPCSFSYFQLRFGL